MNKLIQTWRNYYTDEAPIYTYTTKPYLRVNDTYCVLGLLCNSSQLGQWEQVKRNYLPTNSLDTIYSYITCDEDRSPDSPAGTTCLPKSVQKQANLVSSVGAFNIENISTNHQTYFDNPRLEGMVRADLTILPTLFEPVILHELIPAIIDSNALHIHPPRIKT